MRHMKAAFVGALLGAMITGVAASGAMLEQHLLPYDNGGPVHTSGTGSYQFNPEAVLDTTQVTGLVLKCNTDCGDDD